MLPCLLFVWGTSSHTVLMLRSLLTCAIQADLMFKRESAKGMGANEEAFDGAIDVNQTYWWHDKYRPRKPRYFNRVHTG